MKKKVPRAPYRGYEANQQKILDAYETLNERDKITLPSYEQLAEESGLSTRTVQRHFANLDFDYICKRERVHSPGVIESIRKSAKEGKSRAQKLYAQIMEGYIEKKEQKTDIVGDLNVNADISGELKVNIQRGIIKSREDLDRLRDIKKALQGVEDVDVKTGMAVDNSLGQIKKIVTDVVQDIDKLVCFK